MANRRTCAVVGGGTMGADIALTLARAGCPTHVVETFDTVRAGLPARLSAGLAALGCPQRLDRIDRSTRASTTSPGARSTS